MWQNVSKRLYVLAVAFSVTACSVFGGKAADEPAFRVLLDDGNVEIREYDSYAVAETRVPAPFDEAIGTGFRRLFNYISGANRNQAGIEMTAPVLVEPGPEQIRMLASETIGGWAIAFVLPAGYTAATAPVPDDVRVTVRDVEARRVASIRFSGLLRTRAAEARRQALARWLEARGFEHAGDWQIAGYNPPWTLPPLRRNEVLVTLR